MRRALQTLVVKTAFKIETLGKEAMAKPKTGRFYRIGSITKAVGVKTKTTKDRFGRERLADGSVVKTDAKGRRRAIIGAQVYQASAPGQAPAVRPKSGVLFNSAKTTIGDLEGMTAWQADYARFLEEGTKFMQPRPWIAPAIEAVTDDFLSGVSAILKNQ